MSRALGDAGQTSEGESAKPDELLRKALNASRESRQIEFKRRFDPSSTGAWCEIVKDIVAIANSGGGVIVFGLDDHGDTTGDSTQSILNIDPADSANRVFRYTGISLEFEIQAVSKKGQTLAAFIIPGVDTPIVFHKAGTYSSTPGSTDVAFHMGTLYVRHGAKSEPATTDDIRKAINRRLEQIRKSWIRGVKKVVRAPPGSQIIAVPPSISEAGSGLAREVRIVNDSNALPVRLTRDPNRSTGKFVHEQVSELLLDEINNVIEVNRILARGQRKFFLGKPVYFRVYAEREHAIINGVDADLLLNAAVTEFYAPGLFWLPKLSNTSIAEQFKFWYEHPKQPQCLTMIRLAALLGEDFSRWLWQKYQNAWKHHAQPPGFFWSLKELPGKLRRQDRRLVAAHQSPNSSVGVPREAQILASVLLNDPQVAAFMLSKACMQIFNGEQTGDLRETARALDYLSYGNVIVERSGDLGAEIMDLIGAQAPALPDDAPKQDEPR